jgi:diguanylate cyclase (GGDEF)-like protein
MTMGRHESLWQLTMADPHTGLPNRLVTLDRLDQALIRRERHHTHVMVLSIEVRNLDNYTFAVGTEILSELARRLTASIRAEDTPGRVGGTELAVVISTDDESAVEAISRRLQAACQRPLIIDGQCVQIATHFGTAVARNHESAEELLERARQETKGSEPAPA